jgi:hypothetical protein
LSYPSLVLLGLISLVSGTRYVGRRSDDDGDGQACDDDLMTEPSQRLLLTHQSSSKEQ